VDIIVLCNGADDLDSLSKESSETEGIETAEHIIKILIGNGHNAKLKRYHPDLQFDCDMIVNLAESFNNEPHSEIKIAEHLERLNIPFTGSGSKSLKICLSKDKTKQILKENGINTPSYALITKINEIPEKCKSLKYPLIIKPEGQDASIGIHDDSVIFNMTQLENKSKQILKEYGQAIIEEFIDGRELYSALIGNERLNHLPISEIDYRFAKGIPKMLTYKAKWDEDSDEYQKSLSICPTVIEKSLEEKIIEIAKKCFKLLGLRDYGRVDFRVKDNQIFVLEVNPNPCINPNDSGFKKALDAQKISYENFILSLIKMAINHNSSR
jgi:D-alanine-D-alanine ligase